MFYEFVMALDFQKHLWLGLISDFVIRYRTFFIKSTKIKIYYDLMDNILFV